jgi:hypothetical protein
MCFVFVSDYLVFFSSQVIFEDGVRGQKRSLPIDSDGESHFIYNISARGMYCASK